MNVSTQITRNTFEKGINSDLNPASVAPGMYRYAQNLSLTGDGSFGGLQNVLGTTKIADLFTSPNQYILGVFPTRYKITEDNLQVRLNVPCLTVISCNTFGLTLTIHCVDLTNGTVRLLYTESISNTYYSSASPRIFDGVAYAESGLDVLYLTDNYPDHVWKLRCEAYQGIALTERQLRLIRPNAMGNISLNAVTTGGSLLTGTYQIAFQLADTVENRFTDWSPLTNPIHVYSTVAGITTLSGGAYSEQHSYPGIPSDKKITVDVALSFAEAGHYDKIRFAIVENIWPEGADPANLTQVGITEFRTAPVNTTPVSYEIKTNYQSETIPLEDVVIESAPISSVKSFEIVDNRLLLGGVVLKNLTLDNGSPNDVVIGGSFVTQSNGTAPGDSFSSEDFSSKYKGYFRDETYRFAICYFDKYGNYSEPFPLKLDAVLDNQAPSNGNYTDVHFPPRSFYTAGRNYTILDSNGVSKSLGLSLTNLRNHPTWAYGFIILRAKRRKKILFQTPTFPMPGFKGVGTIGEYPSTYRPASNSAYVSDTNAEPMSTNAVYFPGNPLYSTFITADEMAPKNEGNTDGTNYIPTGENAGMWYPAKTGTLFSMYPQDTMYSKTPFVFGGMEEIQTADACVLNLIAKKFVTTSGNLGGAGASVATGGFGSITNQSRSYYGLADANQYYNSAWAGAKAALTTYRTKNFVVDSANLDNYSEGVVLAGSRICQAEELNTKNLSLGRNPITNRFVAVKVRSEQTVFNTPSTGGQTLNFAAGNPTFVSTLGSNPAVPTTQGFLFYGLGETGALDTVNICGIVEIVNVTAPGIKDDRYGTIEEDTNEYIFTGYKRVFSSAEQALVAVGTDVVVSGEIWGGDCIVSPHTFKLQDSCHILTNQIRSYKKFIANGSVAIPGYSLEGIAEYFEKSFKAYIGGISTLNLPVGAANAAVYLTVWLESEWNGSVKGPDTASVLWVKGNGMNIYGASTQETASSPLAYKVDHNLTKQNDQKIWFPIDSSVNRLYDYKARIYFTDKKIYQSSIDGFDTVPVGNYIDLEERYGAITKLAFCENNLYSIQEDGVAYIPTTEKVVELTDSSQLGVRSGDVLGAPLYLATGRGSQHLATVQSNGKSIYFVDNRRKAVYNVTGRNVVDIANMGFLSQARSSDFLKSEIVGGNLFGVYDPVRGEYWVARKNATTQDEAFCFVFSEKAGSWVSNYDIPFAANFSWGGFANDKLYLVGANTTYFEAASMYTGNPVQFFGRYASDAYVDFIVNPVPDRSKTFDNVILAASDKLHTLNMSVAREVGLIAQTTYNVPLEVDTRGEGLYKVKVLRDELGGRMRGRFADVRVNWRVGDGDPQVTLLAALTAVRPSI